MWKCLNVYTGIPYRYYHRCQCERLSLVLCFLSAVGAEPLPFGRLLQAHADVVDRLSFQFRSDRGQPFPTPKNRFSDGLTVHSHHLHDEIQVAGIMHGLRVQKSRRDQRLYAQATLEDATGKMELICFARDYEKLAEQLKIEAPVLVRGTLMGDEDAAPKIAVSHVQPLEEVQVKLPGGVRIRINLDRATEDILAQLKSAAEAAPGPGKVMLQLEKKGEYAVILEPEGMNVAADRGWVERIEELAGKGSVQAVS